MNSFLLVCELFSFIFVRIFGQEKTFRDYLTFTGSIYKTRTMCFVILHNMYAKFVETFFKKCAKMQKAHTTTFNRCYPSEFVVHFVTNPDFRISSKYRVLSNIFQLESDQFLRFFLHKANLFVISNCNGKFYFSGRSKYLQD